LLGALGKGELPPLDAALSIAEGYGSRNREAWAPALLEMAGVPLLGSDALALSTSLDKVWAKQRVAAAGVPVASHVVVDGSDGAASSAALGRAAELGFPLFVKPRWEGTSKGITAASRVVDANALAAAVARIGRDYAQPALVERFLPGAEYSVTVVGHGSPRALPVLQRGLEADSGIGLHALERTGGGAPPRGGYRHATPGSLDCELEGELQAMALLAFEALECHDFARMDFKYDEKGAARFLEANPLPTFATDGSFGILAELAGRSYAELVGEVLAEALERIGLGTAGVAAEPT
jgi:D-alanine-D-alanine ligase